MQPRALILETSGRPGWVALAEGAVIRNVRRLDETRRHARDLAPAVQELLRECSWKPREIQVVIVSRGPGSYTGLRVGITSAKVFAYATGCGLIGVDTFAAIAMQAPPVADAPGSPVDVVADAQQDKIYVQRYVGGAPRTELAVTTIAEWLAQCEPAQWVSGPGVRALRGRLPDGCRVIAEELWNPQPESLLRLGLERYQRGERDDPFRLEPSYLRPSSAEEKWSRLGR